MCQAFLCPWMFESLNCASAGLADQPQVSGRIQSESVRSTFPAASVLAAASHGSGRMQTQPPLPDQPLTAPSSPAALQKPEITRKRKVPGSSTRATVSETTDSKHAGQSQAGMPDRTQVEQVTPLLQASQLSRVERDGPQIPGGKMLVLTSSPAAQPAAPIPPTSTSPPTILKGQPSRSNPPSLRIRTAQPVITGPGCSPSTHRAAEGLTAHDFSSGQQQAQHSATSELEPSAASDVLAPAPGGQKGDCCGNAVLSSLQAEVKEQSFQTEAPKLHSKLEESASQGMATQRIVAPQTAKQTPLLQSRRKKQKKSIEKPPPAAKSWQDWLK